MPMQLEKAVLKGIITFVLKETLFTYLASKQHYGRVLLVKSSVSIRYNISSIRYNISYEIHNGFHATYIVPYPLDILIFSKFLILKVLKGTIQPCSSRMSDPTFAVSIPKEQPRFTCRRATAEGINLS